MDVQAEIDRYVRVTVSGTDATPMLKRLVNFYLWVERGACMIRDNSARLVRMAFRAVQLRVLRRMMGQAARGKPVRIIVGKSRKTGISTLIQALGVFLCSIYPLQRAITLTHTGKATTEIFSIAVRIAKEWQARPPSEEVGGMHDIKWPDVDSWYSSGTAGGVAVGAGGTPSLLHMSEVAKWEKRKSDTELNATTAVPDNPETIIIYESTFVGRDLFWKRFDDARRGLTPYEAEFVGWWMDPELHADPGEHFERTRTEQGIAQIAAEDGIELSDGMLMWRRNKIAMLGGDLFRQEYPTTPEEAIQATKGLIFGQIMRKAFIDELPFDTFRMARDSVDKIGGIDFGYADPTVIYSGYRYDNRVFVDQCWWGVETLADEQVQGIRPGTTYYCDPSGLNFRKELGRACKLAGVPATFVQAPRTKAPGEDIATVELRNLIQAIESGKLNIVNTPEAQIEELLAETDTLSWDERTGRPDMQRTDEAFHFDRIMALKYLVMGANRPRVAPRTVGRRKVGKGRSFRV
jgi:hypothetical protein